MHKRYSGIGSRDTPSDIGKLMTQIAVFLESYGYGLNSGGAPGADSYFEEGSTENFRKIYLPWNGFNGKHENGKDYIVPEFNDNFIQKYHPKPSKLTEKGKLLMSRNTYQVLGDNLNVSTKVDFVLCWTSNGGIKGGTGQAMRVAKNYGIPIFNMNGGMDSFKFYVENFII